MTLETGLAFLVWIVGLWGALLLALTLIGLVGAALDWIWDGFDIEPVRDRHDTRDPLIETAEGGD